jgi:hypothetical protein
VGALKLQYNSQTNLQVAYTSVYTSEGVSQSHALAKKTLHDTLSSKPQYGWYHPWFLTVNRKPRFVFQFGNF